MNDRSFVVLLNTRGADLDLRWIANRPQGPSDTTGPPHWRFRGGRPRRPPTSAQRRRARAFVTEHLEVRSVPSGLMGGSLSALISTVPTAVHSAEVFAHDVETPGTSDGPGAELTPDSTTLHPLTGALDSAATGAALGLLSAVFKAGDTGLVPVIPPIDVAPGSLTTVARLVDADAAGTPLLFDGSATISATVAPTLIVPGFSNSFTSLVGRLDPVLDPGGGGAAVGSHGEGIGISITGGSGLAGTEISASVSKQGIDLTLPGLQSPTAEPTPQGGSPAVPLPSSGNLGAVGSAVASHAPSTGPIAGDAAQADGNAVAAQPAAVVPNGGSAASSSLVGDVTGREAASSTTGASSSATASGPAGDAAAVGQGRVEIAPNSLDSSSVDNGLPMASEIARAELLPGDLVSLERALAQLMRRFDGIGKDLAGLFTELGTTEMLIAAGIVVLAGDAIRRWERRRRLTLPRAQSGLSGRPGPFYRPRACPFGRPVSGRMARHAIL
jgi:hypothetical protein